MLTELIEASEGLACKAKEKYRDGEGRYCDGTHYPPEKASMRSDRFKQPPEEKKQCQFDAP